MKEKLKEWKDKVLTPERIRTLKDFGWYMFGACVGAGIYIIYTNHTCYLFDRKSLDAWCDQNNEPRFSEVLKSKK